MNKIELFFRSEINMHMYVMILIAILYIVVHAFRDTKYGSIIDIYLNYIPVLTHEFGHIFFNRISGGRAKDLVIVATPKERSDTLQQGYAITMYKTRICHIITTFGGYIMPPIMLAIGVLTIESQKPSLFILAYLFIFIYFLCITSRKLLPFFIVIFLIALLTLLFKFNEPMMIPYIVSFICHFILGVLLGEVLQSSWTIIRLNLTKQYIQWDGRTLKELTYIPIFMYSVVWITFNLYTAYNLFFGMY